MSIFARIVSAIEGVVHSHRAMSMDEVNQSLEALAATRKEKLFWKTSIIDLLKLLKLDDSFQARRALAEELGLNGNFVGSTDQNNELHALVMREVAKRCISIPKE